MSTYYIYLISSLPVLRFEEKVPFSFEEFLDICGGLIPEEDIAIIKNAPDTDTPLPKGRGGKDTLCMWRSFDKNLRNELVRIRSARKKHDPSKYLREYEYSDPSIMHVALSAARNPSLLEAEKTLDLYRWRFLDGLERGHYFDIDLLIVYACKLAILEKWARAAGADKKAIVDDVLAGRF